MRQGAGQKGRGEPQKPHERVDMDIGSGQEVPHKDPQHIHRDGVGGRDRSEGLGPDPQIEGVKNISLPLSEEEGTLGGIQDLSREDDLYHHDPHAAFKMMCDHYSDHVVKAHDQNTVRQVLTILAEKEDGATILHCTEGKDRTGFVVLFVLYILGVELEVIRQDYLASNSILSSYRAERDKKFENAGENLTFRSNMRILSSASGSFFDTVLLTIDEQYLNMDAYVKNVLDVTPGLRDRLRELYLEEK